MSHRTTPETLDRIAARAYQRFVARGGEHGHDLEDWLAAEAELAPHDVVLIDPGAREIELVREIRDLTGLSLVVIKSLITDRTRPIKQSVPRQQAEEIQRRLETLGARVEVRSSVTSDR